MAGMTATSDTAFLPAGRPLTTADLEGLADDGRRYEMVDGVLVVSPAPDLWHQEMVLRLYRLLDDYCPDDLHVLAAPFAVHPDQRRTTELQPDVLVARQADFTRRDLPTAPLLAVEVLSPSTRIFDLTLKRAAYERMRTPSYWVLDPDGPDLRAFELDPAGHYVLAAHVTAEEPFDATLPFPVRVVPADLLSRTPRGGPA